MIVIVLGGLTFGVFSATEGAAVGAILAVGLRWPPQAHRASFWATLMDTARTTAMIYVIVSARGCSPTSSPLEGPDAFVAAIRDSGLPPLRRSSCCCC